jgi:DNA-binding IclR family transcriptional regulator
MEADREPLDLLLPRAAGAQRRRPSAAVQSVDRAMRILEILEREGAMAATSLAVELGVHQSTVLRLLMALRQRGLVEQQRATQEYRLGSALIRLAGAVHPWLDLTCTARPVCAHLSERLGETVSLAVLKGGEVVNIDQVNRSTSVVRVDSRGRRTGLHATSTGKVFLASLPDDAREDVLCGDLERMTDRTITDPDRLRTELDVIRRRGWGSTEEELELGLNAVAAPIHRVDGSVLAALCVSGPVFRLTHDRIDRVGQMTADAAKQVSQRAGATDR